MDARSQTELVTVTPGSPPVSQPSLLRDDRDFRLYWLSRLSSLTGSLTTAVAMPVLVYQLSGSASLTALTTMLEALPYLVFGLFSGALADRWNRQRVMVVTDTVNVVLIASVPVAWWLGILTVWHALVAAFLVQVFFTLFDGANFGALPVLVGRDRVGEANAAVWSVGGMLDLTVPAGVGVLLAVIHPADLLVLDAASYAFSAFAVRAIRRPMSVERAGQVPLRAKALLADVAEGLRFLWNHPGIRSMTVVGTLQSFAGAGFIALIVVWCDRVLLIGNSGWRFGVLFSVWGIGGILAAVALPRLMRRMPTARIVIAAIPLSAVAGVFSASQTQWVAAAIGLTVWGLFYQLVIVASLTYRQLVTPEHLLGRVNTAGRMLSFGVGWTLGALAAGVVANQVGVRPTMITMAGFGILAAGFAWLSPLRRAAFVAVGDGELEPASD